MNHIKRKGPALLTLGPRGEAIGLFTAKHVCLQPKHALQQLGELLFSLNNTLPDICQVYNSNNTKLF